MDSQTNNQAGSTFLSSTRLVAEREIRTQIQSKGFWLTFAVLVVGIFAMSLLPRLFDGGSTSVAAVGAEAAQIAAAGDLDVQEAADQQAAEDLVRSGDVDAAIIPDPAGDSPVGLRIIALSDAPDDVILTLSVSPPVDLLEPADVSEGVRFLVTFLFALIFFMFAMSFGMAIAQSVVTEKQTRIVEILVATIPVRTLLAGKIVGYSLLVFGQVAVLAVLTPVALRAGEQDDLLDVIGGALGWFVPFFILGFVLLAGMWAVAGAVISRQEDLGSSTSLVMTLVMVPYMGVIFFRGNDLVMTILSYLPFSAPVAMPARLFAGDADSWEPFVALGLLAVAVVACVLVASRLYSGSLLQTGGKVGLSKAWARTE
ncbi:ABC transporter permease [Phytoactinopolyspora mesophila]|uniref:ABC transporter permease subunit n=1 Tax=Phytoactinopolyspora mesophila TaxID=2650750 RepID=A0A7K3MBE2_9ACTN|nr:ABC transporter permease [Phytoactinopolyspora mesophila]NDL60470.1 ABC transporter permease subunit [Phytoactinopolyspora mesophila]